ncbi:MFS transporter [Roseomonas sp. CCTCC AB2023176]|uniref:MFS transporter n=1 Tax=Roseomonas sp. CCTCC AB2023176 TaxID=3342640 RepID=UPI0035DABEAE
MNPLPRLLAAAGGIHLADQVTVAALPLTAVLVLGAGPGTVGALLTAQTLAWLLLSLPAGVLVDRVGPVRLLAASGLAGAAGLAVAALGTGSAVVLGIGSFLASAGTVTFVLAAGSAVPALAGRADLPAVNARLELARAVVTLAAPALAGWLAEHGAIAWAYPLAAVGAFICWVAASGLPAAPVPAVDRPPLGTQLREGAAFVTGQPILRGIALCAVCWNFGFFALLAAYVPFGLGAAGLDPATLGTAGMGYGAGLLLGAAAVPAAMRRLGANAVLVFGPAASVAAPLLILAAALPGAPGALLVFAGQFLLGFGPMMWLVCQVSIRQAVTPPALLGRVGATIQVAIYGVRPIGALAGGAVAATQGPAAGLVLAALAFGLSLLVAVVSDLRRLRAIPA